MTRPHVICLAVFLLLTASALGDAEHLPTKIFTTADGLANNLVNRIVVDSHGYLWICTREGLSRFDGYSFTTYGIDDGLPGANINGLIETNEGRYWIATNKGLVRFDPLGTRGPAKGDRPMFRTFLPEPDPRTHDISSVFQDRTRTIWIGTDRGLYKLLDPAAESVRFLRVDLGGAQVVGPLTEDSVGALWIGTWAGVLRRFADGRVEQYAIPNGLPANDVNAVLADRQGRIWVGTRSGGVAVLRADRTDVRPRVAATFSMQNGLTGNWVYQLFEARDGAIWVATAHGLGEIVPEGADRYRLRTFAGALGLASTTVQAITDDRIGNLWAGTAEGIVKIPTTNFTAYGDADGIRATGTLFETPNDGVIAMEMRGYWRFFRCADRQTIAAALPPSAIPSWGWNQVAMVDSAGDWWIGTRSGVLRYHGVSRLEQLAHAKPVAHYTRRDGLAADVVLRLFEDSHRDVWIATVEGAASTGLSRWERKSGTFHQYSARDGLPPLDRVYVSAFGEDQRGNVWIGFTGDGGLVRYRKDTFERFAIEDGIPAGAIRNLITDGRGRLWAANYRAGLIRIDHPSDERPIFLRYTTAQGLSSNEVSAVVDDAVGHIYAATGRGLDRLDPDSGRIRTYWKGESLPVGEINAAMRDRAGVLWASYIAGVIRILPADDRPSGTPPVLISGVSVAGEPQPISAVGQSELPPLELPWDRNSLEVDFAAPGFGPGDGLRYQIKLEGGGSDWSAPSEQRRVTYANLAPGRYRFLARTVNAEGVTSDATAGFSFSILPPIWQRWWFKTAAVLLISGLAYSVYRYRVSRLLEVVAMRTRIATDLHDDIGANLTRIAVLSEVVRRKGHADAEDQLASIATVARESVAAMSDIVWAISPGRDGLDDLASKMREHAEELFAANDTALVFTAPAIAGDLRLSVDTRRDVFLIFKEAINNAARHSGCSHVNVSLEVDASALILSVVDDGAGFDLAFQDQGNGLASMRRRAERLGARLDIFSRPDRGTSVLLEFPHHRPWRA